MREELDERSDARASTGIERSSRSAKTAMGTPALTASESPTMILVRAFTTM